MCFDFSNGLQEKTISRREMVSILDWIGFSVDIASLKTFFSQKVFTILAVWDGLNTTVRDRKHSAAFDVLLCVHLSIMDREPWTIGKPHHDFSYCIRMAPNRVTTLINAYPCDQCELDTALRDAVSNNGPIELVKGLISAGATLQSKGPRTSVDNVIRCFASRECEAVDLALLKIVLEAGAVVDEAPPHDRSVGWTGPHDPVHATDYLLLKKEHSAHNSGLWSLVSSYSNRQHTTITVPGVFEAAQAGQEQLRSYLNARSKPYDHEDRKQVFKIALSEASGRGCANVVQSLVRFGVDPNLRMLTPAHRASQHFRCQKVWHPVIRAANSGELNTLRILITVPSLDIALLEQQVGDQLDICALRNMENSQRDQILRVLSTLDLSTATRSDILLYAMQPHRCQLRGHDCPDFGLVSQLLELGLACLDRREHLDRKLPHIIVRAIKNGCGTNALKFLVERDVGVLSAPSATTIAALLDATLKRYGERHEILEFLSQKIEGLQSYIQENVSSLLLSFLKNMRGHRLCVNTMKHWENDCAAMVTVKWFLDLGATLKGPVLAKLVRHANDSFMLAMIHRVADLNTLGYSQALQWSIYLERLNLAVALIERGAQGNGPPASSGGHPSSALQLACEAGAPLWFIRFVVDQGADVNAPLTSNKRPTALQAACHNGAQLSYIKFLLEKGADVNAPPAPEGGFTALQYAARNGLMNIVTLLLGHGADVNALSGYCLGNACYSFTRAIDLAAKHSRLDMVHFLIAAGGRSCQPGSTGFEGAIKTATRERNFAVGCLLQEHADTCSGDPMEVERRWLRQNPHACMYNGSLQVASWVAFVKRKGGNNKANFRKYMKEELN